MKFDIGSTVNVPNTRIPTGVISIGLPLVASVPQYLLHSNLANTWIVFSISVCSDGTGGIYLYWDNNGPPPIAPPSAGVIFRSIAGAGIPDSFDYGPYGISLDPTVVYPVHHGVAIMSNTTQNATVNLLYGNDFPLPQKWAPPGQVTVA